MRPIDADRLTPRCMFRGRCDSGGGSRCDRCTDYAVQYQDIENAPTVQPDDDRLERCRFEYVNACKILAHRNPDTTKKDIEDAYAVVRTLNPIFGEEGF